MYEFDTLNKIYYGTQHLVENANMNNTNDAHKSLIEMYMVPKYMFMHCINDLQT